MGSIQEALRELKNQRKINESKTRRTSKTLKESKSTDNLYYVTLDDGKVVKVNAKSEEDAKKQVENNDELIHVFKDGDNIGYRAHITNVSKTNPADESLKESAPVKESAYDKIKALADKYKRTKSEDLHEDDIQIDQDGDAEVLDFNLDEACKDGNCDLDECDQALQEDVYGQVDADGDVELLDFNLTDMFQENLSEALNEDEKLTVANVKKDKDYSALSNKVINKLIDWAKEDYKAKTISDFLDWIGGYNDLAELAVTKGNTLDATDFLALVEGNRKFDDVITKIAKKINWINNDGYYVDDESDGTRKNAKKPTTRDLTLEFIRLASPKDKNKEYTFKILKNAYIDNDYSELDNTNLSKVFKKLHEDLESSMPVHAMGEEAAIAAIRDIKNGKAKVDADGNVILDEHGDPVWSKHPTFFALEYFYEIAVASKYRGGRGSTPDDPIVRIFKDVKFSKLYSGYSYESLGSVKQFRAETGKERSDRATGVNFGTYMNDNDLALKIADGKNGKLFRVYLTWDCRRTVTYYISIDDGDLVEATREEVAQYLTPGDAAKLLQPKGIQRKSEITDTETGEVKQVQQPQPANNYKLGNIVSIRSFNN